MKYMDYSALQKDIEADLKKMLKQNKGVDAALSTRANDGEDDPRAVPITRHRQP